MLVKLLSSIILPVYSTYKRFTIPGDYTIVSEELEYSIDHRMKYQIEDDFWQEESKSWDGSLKEFHSYVTGKSFRNTIVPQNVKTLILRVKYYQNGKIYKAISNNINFKPGESEESDMCFTIPLSSAWIVDQDDKPIRDITEKVRRYSGPRNDVHGERVSLQEFLYYTPETLKKEYPKIMLTNALGVKKLILTTEDFTTDLLIP